MAFSLVLSAGSALAQNRVSGVVKDRNGEPLIGANVYIKGTTISTISGINGEFNINAPSDAVVVISFEGYHDLEVTVADLPTANLQLKPEKLISTAAFYGNDGYYALTTANTLINSDETGTGLETDIYQYLIGKVPGLEVVPSASGEVCYRMRGGDSPSGNVAEPLFVVDGMYDLGGNMAVAALNPNDIESIRVLKDIAATVQYGEFGRNGVIVIKTRRPSDKMLAASYDGNVSFNTYDNDDKWAGEYKNSVSTKQNVAVNGLAGPMPYRAALGFNSIGGAFEDSRLNLLSGSVWLGPRLLDKHLSIDLNSYYRKRNELFGKDNDLNQGRLTAILKTDYSVHSLEDVHLNLSAGYTSDLDSSSMTMLDGNVDLHHQFGKNYFIELKAGAATYIHKNTGVNDASSFYGQFNLALNRYVMNVNARYNMFDGGKGGDYGTLTSALSMGVKVGGAVVLRGGLGVSGFTIGSRPDGVGRLSALTYNFGLEGGSAASVVHGSADFYVHHNTEQYVDESQKYKTMSINNVGVDFRVSAKLIDTDKVKWRIGGNLAINSCVILDADDYTNSIIGTAETVDWGPDDKPQTFYVYEPVYDQNGSLIPNLFVDTNNDGIINAKDRVSTECSPVPTVVGGFSTYLEVMGGYLQIDTHGSADKYSAYMTSETMTFGNIHNSSFMRIDNIVIGYKFSNLWLMSGRAYFALQNPYVFTKYEGRDPEIYDGVDYFGICQRPRIFSIGVKLNINIKD